MLSRCWRFCPCAAITPRKRLVWWCKAYEPVLDSTKRPLLARYAWP